MSNKNINNFEKAINLITERVGSTFGPNGRTVMILESANRSPLITKDGVTVARAISSEDAEVNGTMNIIKQASIKTNLDAGDGTTTACILSQAIYSEIMKFIRKGTSPVKIKREMDAILEDIWFELPEYVKNVTSKQEIASVATISANNDRVVGNMIAEAIDKIGTDGAVVVEPSKSTTTMVDLFEGFKFDISMVSNRFYDDIRRMHLHLDEPMFLITDYAITNYASIMPVLEQVARKGDSPLVIIADEFGEEVLASLVLHHERGAGTKIIPFKLPRYGEARYRMMYDMAMSTNASFIEAASGLSLKDVDLRHLGSAKSFEVLNKVATIVGGHGEYEKIQGFLEILRENLKGASTQEQAREYHERIARLSAAVAVIRVGGATEAEMKETKDRIDDALAAVKSAQLEGILPGGGVMYLNTVFTLLEKIAATKRYKYAGKILSKALMAPILKLCENNNYSQRETKKIIKNITSNENKNYGFDFYQEKYGDMLELGVIEPARVFKSVIINACSIANVLANTRYSINRQ